MTTHNLSVLVSNKPGVLARVAGLFSRRGFNIDSLAVGPTEKPGVSRMTLSADVAEPAVLEQLVKQLNKLIEVYKVIELEPAAITREMVLVKVRSTAHDRGQIIDLIGLTNHDQGCTIVIATHDPLFAEGGRRVVRMRDGRAGEGVA